MKKQIFLNQVAFTVEVHDQLRNVLSNTERKKAIRNHPLIHAIIIIYAMNLTVRNQINASDVDRRMISSQNLWNRAPWIREFTGKQKSLKLLRIYQQKYIRRRKKYRRKRFIEDLHVYGMYVYQYRKS